MSDHKNKISAIILTYNEELNIDKCLSNISDWAEEIFLVDSFSSDRTLEIAEKYNAIIVQHKFENQAQQFNWALDNLSIKNEWILRLDADEYLTSGLKREISETLPDTKNGISGFFMKRRVYFMGRWIKHGGYYPFWFLRLFRKGDGRCEEKKMDEHIALTKGVTVKLKNDFIDENKKGLEFWLNKHIKYASREAMDILEKKNQKFSKKVYLVFPKFIRAFIYFIYRYFIRLGFLDGKEGLIFHFLQGFWYRFLVDVKIYEIIEETKKQ